MTTPLDLHQLRDDLRAVTGPSGDPGEVLRVMASILDALLSEMVRVYDETTAMVDATQYVVDQQAGDR